MNLGIRQRLHPGVREIQGVVVKQGINPKTIVVRAWWKTWDFRYRIYFKRGKNYQVHDEENYCRIGDQVVIKTTSKPVSNTKNYYVRNIIHHAPRFDTWNALDSEKAQSLQQKLYEVVDPETNQAENFRVRALKERLINLRAARILEDSAQS